MIEFTCEAIWSWTFVCWEMFFLNFYLFIYLFMAVLGPCLCTRALSSCGKRGPILIAVRGLSRPLLLQSTGSRRAGSAVVAHGPSCSTACGILPDQGSNPRPLHRQADSQPLRHQGSPYSLSLCLDFYSLYPIFSEILLWLLYSLSSVSKP